MRSSFAMFLHLNKIPAEKIMLQGRWKSMVFLNYIRPQISEFSRDLSRVMLQVNNFFTTPDDNAPNNAQQTTTLNTPPHTLTIGQRYDQRMLITPQCSRLQHLIWI